MIFRRNRKTQFSSTNFSHMENLIGQKYSGEDEELIQRQKRREMMIRNKQMAEEAEYEEIIRAPY